MSNNPDFDEAMALEQEEIADNLEDLMAEMLGNVEQGGGHVRPPMDEAKVRKMVFAAKYLREEEERLKRLKKAVMEDWDRRIKQKQDNIRDIQGLIEQYLKEENKGKALKLDIGTASLRTVKHNINVNDALLLRAHLEQTGEIMSFLKPPEVDTTAAKNAVLEKIEKGELNASELPPGLEYKPEDKSLSFRFTK